MLAISFFFSLLKIVSILQPVYSFNNEFLCVEKTATLFPSSPSCSKGGWRYLGNNSTDFDSIWPMDSSLYTLNNWALIHVYVISCRTLTEQEDCLRTFSTYQQLLHSLLPLRAVVFLLEDLSQNAYTASLPVSTLAIHQACNFLPSLGELFSSLVCKRMTPLQVKEIESSVKALSASWIDIKTGIKRVTIRAKLLG